MRKRLTHIFGWFIAVSVPFFFCLFRFSGDTSSQYKDQLVEAAEVVRNTPSIAGASQESLQIGASRRSIIPDEPVRMAGYTVRPLFEDVNDSIYTRVVVFRQAAFTAAIVSLDLMIIRPEMADSIRFRLGKIGIGQVYFSATHTHSSIGGYADSPVGRLILGGRDEVVLHTVFRSTEQAAKKALRNIRPVDHMVWKTSEMRYVKNRLTKTRKVPQTFRQLEFTDTSGITTTLMSFTAHPTIVRGRVTALSNDYPGALMRRSNADFPVFVAGLMGSMTPMVYRGKTSFQMADEYAKMIRKPISKNDTLKAGQVAFSHYRLPMQPLAASAAENIQLRPWLFRLCLGNTPCEITTLRIGDVLMVGLPVELSAEFYPLLDQKASEKGLKLLATCFNGSYMGYAVPSEHFHIRNPETREMNWSGKWGGDYFAQVIQMILEKQ